MPALDDDARARGRQRAVAARRARAQLKRSLTTGTILGEDVVRLAGMDTDTGRAAARMTIGDLLLSLPGVGTISADRILIEAGISGQRRISALGPRQLDALSDVLS